MNKTVLLLLLSTQVFSQKISLFLKNDNFDLQNRGFYINEIRDERITKEVGMLTLNGAKVSLVCIPDVRFEVRNYLKKLLAHTDNSQVAINLIIKDFSLKETSNSLKEINLVFDYLYFDFNQNKEVLVKSVTQKKPFQYNKIDDIENTFKELLQKALTELQNVQWNFFIQSQKSVSNYSSVSPFTDLSLFLVEMGSFNRGFMMKATYANKLRINDKTGIGRCFTYGSQIPYEFDNDEGWTEVSLLLGGDMYKRMKNHWYGNLAFHVPIGIVKTEKTSNFFIGLTTHQRIMSIRHYGAKFSFGAFQTVSTHPFSPLGLGLTLGIGWSNPNDDTND